ncbi:family 20 glycosylhydrolase, partial [candidate division KSB1 bacterium]|nr:family 20 glycosylhydrolase [candidate division KSB1 bacterium]NIR69736.1 family 20 glycosylhydrolase [candidate division KSB1 bacterium]NIS22924.1 family 20 glycosylhydrolase [candidate division KSB1 bacterium]NIT69781.1 family 20 glycosylhydrolase [candidate division KSB1 bacterium]NIU23455.1 family 20 glycosylhydrolase [candidate division KSB1 bacterium]
LVLFEDSHELDQYAYNYLSERIKKITGYEFKQIPVHEVVNWSNIIFVGRLKQRDLPKEIADRIDIGEITKIGDQGYYLQAADSLLCILAYSSQGLFYGSMSLTQLIEKQGEQFKIQGVTLYDWPTFKFRGVCNDFSQGPIPDQAYFKRIVQFLSQFKLNAYLLHLSPKRVFEHDLDLFSGQELTAIQLHARKHHVKIIPVIETLAGLEEILAQPEYAHLAEFPGASTITPLKEGTYDLLDQLIFEVTQTFDSPYLYVGGRGSQQVGWHSSKSAVEQMNLIHVLAEHFNHVIEVAKKYDKQVLMDSKLVEVHPTLLHRLPEDVIYIHQPQENGIDNSAFRNVFVSDVLWDQGNLFPQYDRRLPDIAETTKHGASSGINGIVVTHHKETSNLGFQQYQNFGLAFAAECAWSPSSIEFDRFSEKYFRNFFGAPWSEAEVVHSLLTDLAHLTTWQEIWQHPLTMTIESRRDFNHQIYQLKTRMSQVLRLLDSLADKAIQSPAHLDYLKFLARNGIWLAGKIETALDLQEFIQDAQYGPSDGEVDQLTNRCLELIEDLNEIRERLQLLWMRNYRSQGLSTVLDLYGLQVLYWQEIIEHIRTGQLEKNPVLSAKWIYHPSTENGASKALFRKTFEVSPGFRTAYLQAIADTHLKVYLNGGFLGDVMFREWNALSSDNVKIWDITSILEPGKNIIAVEAKNYRPGSPAGLNLYGEIQYQFGRTVEIRSDAYWKTSVQEEQNWRKLGFYDVQWLNAVSRQRDTLILQPNFKAGRPSRIERFKK